MKQIVFLSIFLIVFFTGCSSDSGDSSTSSTGNVIVLEYAYNADGASVRSLSASSVNQYEVVQEALALNREDERESNSILAAYIGDLFSETELSDEMPSYAPRGDLKSMIVPVVNAKVDYTSYILTADIDNNHIIDGEDVDLLVEALVKNYVGDEYDVNRDGVIDTRDLVYLLARLNSEIFTFDFYTTSGVKIGIETRSTDDAYSVGYSGDETEVMVVAKDRNGASGFVTGLSDLEDVWYKHSGWVRQAQPASQAGIRRVVNRMGDLYERVDEVVATSPYLVGEEVAWEYISPLFPEVEVNEHFLDDAIFDTAIDDVETSINNHFTRTNMDHPVVKTRTKDEYIYKIGARVGEVYSDFGMDTEIERYVDENGGVVEFLIGYTGTQKFYYSKADKILAGSIVARNPSLDIKGTVFIERIGPDPEALEFSPVPIGENELFLFDDVPFGAYVVDYLDTCLCHQELDSDFVFEDENVDMEYTLESKKVSVILTLLDGNNQPVANEAISLLAKECVSSENDEKSFSKTSDSDGKVVFENVPIGDYTVFVASAENSAINVCDTYSGTLYNETLWTIDITYQGRSCSYTKVVNNVKIEALDAPVKSWENYEAGNYPFPLPTDHVGGKILMSTDYYTHEDEGIALEYYPTGDNGYYQGVSIAVPVLETCVEDTGDTWFGDQRSQEWIGIDTVLDAAQTNALINNQEFIFNDGGRWVNDNGNSLLIIKFTPSH